MLIFERPNPPGSDIADSPERSDVDIRIGIVNSPRELSFESSQPSAEIEAAVAAALESGTKFFKLSDDAGKLYIIPTAGLAYIEVGTEKTRRVGFVA